LIDTCDPDEWDLPPKPKWMRWHTYNRHAKVDAYEDIRDQHTFAVGLSLLAIHLLGIHPMMAKMLGSGVGFAFDVFRQFVIFERTSRVLRFQRAGGVGWRAPEPAMLDVTAPHDGR
jgi:hypothetical protein